MTQKAYAYVDAEGTIHPATIYPTEKGAMVNALMIVFGRPVLQSEDAIVGALFRDYTPVGGRIARIEIREVQH